MPYPLASATAGMGAQSSRRAPVQPLTRPTSIARFHTTSASKTPCAKPPWGQCKYVATAADRATSLVRCAHTMPTQHLSAWDRQGSMLLQIKSFLLMPSPPTRHPPAEKRSEYRIKSNFKHVVSARIWHWCRGVVSTGECHGRSGGSEQPSGSDTTSDSPDEPGSFSRPHGIETSCAQPRWRQSKYMVTAATRAVSLPRRAHTMPTQHLGAWDRQEPSLALTSAHNASLCRNQNRR
jgi:hypothetical protein